MQGPTHIFNCPECGIKLRVAQRQFHLKGPCPKCHATICAKDVAAGKPNPSLQEEQKTDSTPPPATPLKVDTPSTFSAVDKPAASEAGPLPQSPPPPVQPATPPAVTENSQPILKKAAVTPLASQEVDAATPAPPLTLPANNETRATALPKPLLSPGDSLAPRQSVPQVPAAAAMAPAQTHFSQPRTNRTDGMSNGKAFLLLLLTLLIAAGIVYAIFALGLLDPAESSDPASGTERASENVAISSTSHTVEQNFTPEISVRTPSELPVPANTEATQKIAEELPRVELPAGDDLPPLLENVGQ